MWGSIFHVRKDIPKELALTNPHRSHQKGIFYEFLHTIRNDLKDARAHKKMCGVIMVHAACCSTHVGALALHAND